MFCTGLAQDDNTGVDHNENHNFEALKIGSWEYIQKNDSKIQIIGTHVIPEFGTIVMIVLTIGILASILLTKNKFQIKI